MSSKSFNLRKGKYGLTQEAIEELEQQMSGVKRTLRAEPEVGKDKHSSDTKDKHSDTRSLSRSNAPKSGVAKYHSNHSNETVAPRKRPKTMVSSHLVEALQQHIALLQANELRRLYATCTRHG